MKTVFKVFKVIISFVINVLLMNQRTMVGLTMYGLRNYWFFFFTSKIYCWAQQIRHRSINTITRVKFQLARGANFKMRLLGHDLGVRHELKIYVELTFLVQSYC